MQDVIRGANPSLFSKQHAGKPGAPTSTSFDSVCGVCAAAVSILIHGGDSRRAAAAFVADELRRLEVHGPNRQPIEARQILHWRNEVGGRASTLTTDIYHSVVAKVDFASLDSADKRRNQVTEILAGVMTAGF